MEDIERVAPADIEAVRKKFATTSANAGFTPADVQRVKTDDLWIRRFIALREGDVDKAAKTLHDTCQWRKDFGVIDLNHQTISQKMVDQGTLFIRNKDKWGKDMLIFKAKTHLRGANEFEDIKKFIVYWFERIERLTKSGQITVVFDMKDTGLANMDMDFVRYLISLLQQYYPYFINYLLIYEMPWILKSAWNIIKTMLNKKEVERIKFVDKKTINDYIDTQNQLVEWGGTDSYEYSFEPEVKATRKPSLKTLSLNNNLSSSEDSSPEGKAGRRGKVQFTDRDGAMDARSVEVTESRRRNDEVNAPPQVRQRVVRHNASPESGDTSPSVQNATAQTLIETNDVINFTWNGEEFRGEIDITNVSRDNVAFKIKTTSPESYRVVPSIGIVAPGAEATVNLGSSRVLPRSHRFQVLAAILPRDFALEQDESDTGTLADEFPRLNAMWKSSIERRVPIQSKRLQITVNEGTSRSTHENVSNSASAPRGAMVTMNEGDMRKGLLELEQKITRNMNEMLESSFKKQKIILGIILACVVVFGLLVYFTMPSAVARQGVNDFTGSSGSCPGQLNPGPGSNPNPIPGSPSAEGYVPASPVPEPLPERIPDYSRKCACS